MMPTVVISDRARKRLKSKHPWVFSNEVVARPAATPGEIVRVEDSEKHYVGLGYWNPHTLIAIRFLSFQNHFDLEARILDAVQFRKNLYRENVYRLIYGESDFLPGLIVDQYAQILVAQILTAGMENMKQEILNSLIRIVQPSRILLRNDSPYRKLEQLPLNVEWAYGNPLDREVVEMDGLKFLIDFRSGQKTGFFLDQTWNRRELLKCGPADRMMDVFSYTGAWSLYGLRAGIRSVTAVDSSEQSLGIAKETAELNSYSLHTIAADAKKFLRDHYSSGERYDRIVLDPPAFCRSRRQLSQAIRGYREINLRAMKLLKSGGLLFTCSCSQPVSPELFADILQQASTASGRIFRLRRMLFQPPDHPVLLSFPESHYLKCAVLQVV